MSNIKAIGQGVKGLRLHRIGGFPLTWIVAVTTLLRTTYTVINACQRLYISSVLLILYLISTQWWVIY